MNIVREIRLTVNTWRFKLRDAADLVARWYLLRTCPHLWRAALVKQKPARVCKICDLAQELTREDFYAEFGERYQAILYTGTLPRFGDSKPTVKSDSIN